MSQMSYLTSQNIEFSHLWNERGGQKYFLLELWWGYSHMKMKVLVWLFVTPWTIASVHRILQAGTLEWVAIPFYRYMWAAVVGGVNQFTDSCWRPFGSQDDRGCFQGPERQASTSLPPALPCPDLQGVREALSSRVPSDRTPCANYLPHPLLQNKLINIPNNP